MRHTTPRSAPSTDDPTSASPTDRHARSAGRRARWTARPLAMAWLVPAAAGLAIALSTTGCSGPAGIAQAASEHDDAAAYVRTADTACRQMLAVTPADADEVQGRLLAENTSEERFTAAVRRYLGGVVDGMDRSNRTMFGAEAPERWKAFQAGVDRSRPEVERTMGRARSVIGGLVTYEDVVDVESRLTGAGVGDDASVLEDMPADLVAKAPGCRRLRDATASTSTSSDTTGAPSYGSPDPDPSTFGDPAPDAGASDDTPDPGDALEPDDTLEPEVPANPDALAA